MVIFNSKLLNYQRVTSTKRENDCIKMWDCTLSVSINMEHGPNPPNLDSSRIATITGKSTLNP